MVSGCATAPISDAEATPVPVERVLDESVMVRSPGTGQITVKRDSGLGGSACSSRVFVNAKPIADLRTSEKVVFHLPPGEYIFSAFPNGVCGGSMSEVRGTVRDGSAIAFRIGYGTSGDFTINATAF